MNCRHPSKAGLDLDAALQRVQLRAASNHAEDAKNNHINELVIIILYVEQKNLITFAAKQYIFRAQRPLLQILAKNSVALGLVSH